MNANIEHDLIVAEGTGAELSDEETDQVESLADKFDAEKMHERMMAEATKQAQKRLKKHRKEIERLKNSIEKCVFMRFKSSSGKFFFRIILEEHEVAVSRKYTTQLLLQKGIDEIVKYAHKAEFLDFSSAEDVFG